jgi:two-component system LytT family response regulator/two-component system response regulator LytT
MIKCVVVDDEVPAREELKFLLEEIKDINVIGEASHGLEALELNRKTNPDIVFLDIQMPKMSGIEVAKNMIEGEESPLIIFVTAFEEYAIKAFEVNAIDYILKPISKERLEKSVVKAKSRLKNRKTDYNLRLEKLIEGLSMKPTKPINRISVYHNGRLIPLDSTEIIYATLEDKITIIYSERGKFETNCTLNELEKKVDSPSFFRSHKSYLINLDLIEVIEPWFNSTFIIKLKGSSEKIPVSRGQSREFRNIMNID